MAKSKGAERSSPGSKGRLPSLKEAVLSLDPGSKSIGVSLWVGSDFLKSSTFESNKVEWSERVRDLRDQLTIWLLKQDRVVTYVVTEQIPRLAHPSVGCTIGGILSGARFHVNLNWTSFVSPSTWKAWAKKNGASGVEIKGVKALKQTGWTLPLRSDDEADSILIYLAWHDKHTSPSKGSVGRNAKGAKASSKSST